MTMGGQVYPTPAYPLPLQITASGMDLGQFCGQQGSLLGRPPGQREFVSSGNSLRLTFSAPASEDKTPGLHKGFLALYQAVGEGAPRVQGGKSLPTALAPVSFFFFLAVLGLHRCMPAFSSCSEGGYSLVAVLGLLAAVASLIVEHGLNSCGALA